MHHVSNHVVPDPLPVPASMRNFKRARFLNNPVARTILSMWAWLVLGVVLIIWTPLVAIVFVCTAPFDKGRYAAGYLFRKLTVAHQVLNPLWHFRTTGTMITDPRRPYVVVANHESFVDILLISHLPWEMKWLSKATFFKFPLIGWMMRMAGDIKLVRGKRESIVAAMDACKDRLSKRVSVMIFPEGTRTRDGNLQTFKDGAFRLAIETGTPVLPLAVHGAYSALVSGDWRFGVSNAEVRVLPAVETNGMTLDDVATLRDTVRSMIETELNQMKGLDA
jgi:1-acyl-sn-glycerol-3-phosphate acyltransferase